MYDDLTLFAGDSPASPSATRATGWAWTTNGGSGRTWSEPFAYYDPDGCSWRTCQASLLSDSGMSPAAWPPSGTTSNGKAFRRLPSVRPISAGGSSLWPTPVAQDDNKSPEAHLAMRQRMKGGPRKTITSLNVMVKATERGMWPTPTVQDAYNDGGSAQQERNSLPLNAAVKMWPTPKSTPSGPDYA